MESEVGELSNAPGEVERLTTELEELGDPRRAYQRAADIMAKQDEVEEKTAGAKQQVERENQRVEELEEELKAYKELDDKLETERAALKEHEPAHQRYLEHLREAEALEAREEQLASLEEQLEAARSAWKERSKRRDQAAEGYDGEEYEALTKDYERLRDALATLKESLRQGRARLDEVLEEIKGLEQVQEKLVKRVEEHESLKATLTLLNHLRQLLRDAGPEITRRLVDIISAQADRYYAEIMQDYSARLRWTEEYEILLSKDGRERSFAQLSGGEEMAAALAVRLALLQELTGIDVAFFDEPTANLDDLRRDNLAEQILNVRGFSQLFVISHDDTFEQDTDHVVRVIKENGVSRVEV
jgi:exonuclease SbcC